jgi:hypothetical protein
MAISYTDALGNIVDTGCGTQPTARANTEVETHTALEIDTGSKLTPVSTLVSSHTPKRPINLVGTNILAALPIFPR